MIGIEWDRPASLTTVLGNLALNAFPGLMLDPAKCKAVKTVRSSAKFPVPQGDGDIIPHRWLTGYTYNLVAEAWLAKGKAACDADARLMVEELALHLQAMLNDAGRYCWTPSDYGGNRALDEARWFTGVDESIENGVKIVTWSIDSPFPYAIDLTQQAITISGAGSITNAGNISFYPVIQVQGPVVTGFSVINDTLLQGIVYDAGRPGAVGIAGGDYAEIDTYKGTIFLNGDGADLSAGIDPELTNLEDPFVLQPGNNDLESNGADSIFLVNNAWA